MSIKSEFNFIKIAITSLSLLVILLAFIAYFLRFESASGYYGNTDFYEFYQSMRFYFAGQNIYTPVIIAVLKHHLWVGVKASGNLNPPFLTLILFCFYSLNYAHALIIWNVMSFLSMLAGIWLVLKPFKFTRPYLWPIMAGYAVYVPNSIALSYGQISHYLFLIIIAAWLSLRNNKQIMAGILMGIACSLKLFCGLFLIYFIFTQKIKSLISALLTGLLLFIITVSIFGLKSYFAYIQVLQEINWYTASWNASFKGFFTRIFSNLEKNTPLINLPWLGNILVIISSIVLIIYILHIFRILYQHQIQAEGKYHQKKINITIDQGFSLVIISMLLLSPLGWIYYFNLLILPYLVILESKPGNLKHLGMALVLSMSMLGGNLIKTFEIKTLTQIFYSSAIGFYILIIMLVLMINLIHSNSENFISKNRVSTYKFIDTKLWYVIYFLIFIPSFISQYTVLKNIALHFQSVK